MQFLLQYIENMHCHWILRDIIFAENEEYICLAMTYEAFTCSWPMNHFHVRDKRQEDRTHERIMTLTLVIKLTFNFVLCNYSHKYYNNKITFFEGAKKPLPNALKNEPWSFLRVCAPSLFLHFFYFLFF